MLDQAPEPLAHLGLGGEVFGGPVYRLEEGGLCRPRVWPRGPTAGPARPVPGSSIASKRLRNSHYVGIPSATPSTFLRGIVGETFQFPLCWDSFCNLLLSFNVSTKCDPTFNSHYVGIPSATQADGQGRVQGGFDPFQFPLCWDSFCNGNPARAAPSRSASLSIPTMLGFLLQQIRLSLGRNPFGQQTFNSHYVGIPSATSSAMRNGQFSRFPFQFPLCWDSFCNLDGVIKNLSQEEITFNSHYVGIPSATGRPAADGP